MPKLRRILLLLIVAFFLITRLYKISEIPPSVYWDEASIGYNAYSISKDLKDEWGEFLPIHFRAFGEFKLPVYIYSVVPFVQIFGLNEFSVRIPSVLFSLGVVLVTFFLAKKLAGSTSVGLWSSFLLTISPWFFIFSRTGFEVTSGLMFYLLGIYFILRCGENRWFLFIGVLSFILSIYSYNSFRLLTPLALILLGLFEKEKLKQIIKQKRLIILLCIIMLLLTGIPIFRLYSLDAGVSRLQVVGEVSILQVAKNYFSHLNPNFLFIRGDQNLRHQQKGFGQLYIPELILLLAGTVYILRNKAKNGWFLLTLVLISPIPAAITKESPHALRVLSVAPFIHIVSATGIIYLGQILKKKTLVNLGISAVFLIFFLNYFMKFLTSYSTDAADDWQYGYKKIFTSSMAEFKHNGRILIPDKDGQPYIFALFYLKYDPEKFRSEVVRNPIDKWGYSTIKQFGQFEFGE